MCIKCCYCFSRQMMKSSISGIQTFNFEQDLVFDAYIQFKEYVGFVKAMNALKGMKLLFKDRYEDKAWVANIKVSHSVSAHVTPLKTWLENILHHLLVYVLFWMFEIFC